MNAEPSAAIALAAYALVALVLVYRDLRMSGIGWRAWLLYVIERPYVGLLFHWRANRRCPFPASGPVLVMANHSSPVDPMLVWMNHHLGKGPSRFRVIGFLTAKEYYDVPGLHWICTTMRSIPLVRGGKDIAPVREALRRLRSGHAVGVFPEGRINRTDQLFEANTGVAWLALKARVRVYPVFVDNAPGGRNMVEPFVTPSRVYVVYGDPVDLSRYYGRRVSHKLLGEVTQILMTHLESLRPKTAP